MSEQLDDEIVRTLLVLMMLYKEHYLKSIPKDAESLMKYIRTGEVPDKPNTP